MNEMNVQTYLRSGKTLENLTEELGIKVCLHETLPLAILNYSQIDSPKSHPIVIECRGLILETGTWDIVARSFDRFFNLGECEDLQEAFDWTNFYALEKVDGSLINMFFYAGEWHMATRGSFGEGLMENCSFSWKELFWRTFYNMDLNLNIFEECRSYTLELCSPYNKVVTDYPTPKLYLLNYYDKDNGEFAYYGFRNFMTPFYYKFTSVDEVIDHVEELERENPTIEGVVLVDCNLNRIKVKNKKYLSLHKMRGESGFTMKNLLPFILDNETDELLTYYPEVAPKLEKMRAILADVEVSFKVSWQMVHTITNQKEFALKLTSSRPEPYKSVLFTAKKFDYIHDYDCCWSEVLKNQKLYELSFKKHDTFKLEEV